LTAAHRIALIGLPGSGKSTVGESLAKRLDASYYDVDRSIEELSGWSASRWIEEKGLPAFRAAEALFLARLEVESQVRIEQHSSVVVATGGGAVETLSVRETLAVWQCFWLDAPDALLLDRCDSGSRPLLQGKEPQRDLQRLRYHRESYYRDLAGDSIDTSEISPSVVVDVILARLEQKRK
jgi:shikimate kinase